ncbi:MAG: NADH-quinone oxidoreductase subunit C [Acidimicrobiales bacterium]
MSDTEATSGFDEKPVADEAEAAVTSETRFGVPLTSSRGQQVLHPSREGLVDLVSTLRDDEGFRVCVDVTAVDYLAYEAVRALPPGVEPERFEVVVGLLSHRTQERLRLRVQVPADDPTCPSLFDVHPGTEALEREVYDMYGIEFTGHPDLTRILMPEDWDGFPLRKDHPVGAIPVQFKGVQNAR